MSADCRVAESVVVGRVNGGNDANGTSDSGTRSGFFLPCVGMTRLEALACLLLFVEVGSPRSQLLLFKPLTLF